MKSRIGLKLLYVTVIISLLYGIEQILVSSFGIKALLKILLLCLIPVALGYVHKDGIKSLFSFKQTNWERSKISLWLASGVFALIIGAYAVLASYIDTVSILLTLKENTGVNAGNFWYIGLYIIFGNSFIEEYFFRGYLVLQEQSQNMRNIMLYVSAAIFAFYHVTILDGWFSWYIFILIFAGIFVGGILFSWLNAKGKSLYNGWIMHAGADLAIVVIGFWLFYGPK